MRGTIYFIFVMFFIGGALFTGYIEESAFLAMNALLYIVFLIVIGVRKSLTVTWLHIPVILFAACYWIACFYAVDLEAAVLEASRVSSLIPLSFMMLMIDREKLTRLMALWPWIGLFYVVVGILFQLERDGRLESTLQYANALAIVLLVNILISMLLFAKSKSNIQLFLIVVNAAGLLLTFSRSVWVLWLISVVVMIAVIPQFRNKKSILKLAACHLASLIFAMLIKQDILFFLNRISTIQTKTSEFQIRLVYWRDSLKMFADHLFGGSGGGGWAVLQHSYQSQEYYVKFIHNHYIQVFLDIGVFGGAAWLTLIVLFYKNAFTQLNATESTDELSIRGILIIVTVMLLHAGFDFDLTFPMLLAMLLCFMLPVSRKIKEIRIGGFMLSGVISASALIAFFFMWMAAAYLWKEQGLRAVRANDLEFAQKQFVRVERAIPWSNSLLYESAKVDVRKGNESGDPSYYALAEEKLARARSMVPQKKLYIDLIEDINKGKR